MSGNHAQPRPPIGTRRDLPRMIAMMALFFLVVCAVGILRPIKNALALDGLGETDFYKVYLVSAVVVLFVPLYNRVSDRLSWRWLIPAVSLFFALHLVLFRAFYADGSTLFGLVFYGWYDLFAAALVTQFFLATQMFFDARLARRAYPLVIAGGSIGATLGGAVTGFFAQRVGTPDLMLVAAVLIAMFSVGMPLVWGAGVEERRRRRRDHARLRGGELAALLANRQVRLIAGMVLITILVKQLVDYQFNTLSKEVFETRDAISAFQGKFNAATQWLPLVALAGLQPLLKRWGVGLTVLLLPVAMLLANAGLVVFWGIGMVVAAKAAETSLRYSAERAGREILYVPVPEEILLRAKTYIDVAVEKGVGKVASAVLIFVLLQVMSYRAIALVSVALSLVWLILALRVKTEYVRSLGRAIEGRFASLRGAFASLADATSAPIVRRALHGDDAQVAFTLDLIESGKRADVARLAPELTALLDHPTPGVRRRVLDLLTRTQSGAEPARVRAKLHDQDAHVREAAVRALHAASADGILEELLRSEDATVRNAVLACLGRGEMGADAVQVARRAYAGRWPAGGDGDAAARLELALAAGALGDSAAAGYVTALLDDPDPILASTALRSAGRICGSAVVPRLVAALGRASTREAARDALAAQGVPVVPALSTVLRDPNAAPAVRRSIPSVLSRIPSAESVTALVHGALAAETDQLLDRRAIRALSKLRAHNPGLDFDAALVHALIEREAAVAGRLRAADGALERLGDAGPTVALLRRALNEAGEERRENVFRCLGLLFPAAEIHRCYHAVGDGDAKRRAKGLEWLEQSIGRQLFATVAPVLGEERGRGRRGDLPRLLDRLSCDDDAWVACCSARVAAELDPNALPRPIHGWRDRMDPIEKVFLLQRVDLLRDAKSGQLALLASIAEEVDVPAGTVLLRRGEPAPALHVIIRGAVRLVADGGELSSGDGTAFGTWALIDEAPSIVEAVASQPCRLLRIGRDDFFDLLSDHPELAIGLLQGLARRVRTLVA
jgi:ATP:ADP antiporter, AAA family